MSSLIINGKKELQGEISVHGAKNSALPILAACVVVGDECEISNCPNLSDVKATVKILDYLGCYSGRENSSIFVNSRYINHSDIPDCLMRELRSSFVFMGALVSKTGKAVMCAPGGCEIGLRPVDIHLLALEQMGAVLSETEGKIICQAPKGLCGADINLSFPSVGATENIMLAAVKAKGTTYIRNAAREPEIVDLANFLNNCGAEIFGAGESTIVIHGKDSLHGSKYTVMSDRIVTVSYLAAAAVTGSEILVKNADASCINTVLSAFELAGCKFKISKNEIEVKAPRRLSKMGTVRTMPYPGFPTDCQAIVMAMSATAKGTTVFNENIFESRFRHVGELNRMGAKISVVGRSAIVNGVESLYSSNVNATDLRGGMALIIAALGAQGESVINHIEYVDRGYEKIEDALSSIGASIRRDVNGKADSKGA